MDRCVCCGYPVPEGRQVCPQCEVKGGPDIITKDGIPVYFEPKVGKIPEGSIPTQLYIYKMLQRDSKGENNENNENNEKRDDHS